jgi:hypothetical protein
MNTKVVHGGQGRILREHTFANSSLPTAAAAQLPRVLNDDVSSFNCIFASAMTSEQRVMALRPFKVDHARVMSLLRWLKSCNHLYNGVEVVQANMPQIDDDGVPRGVIQTTVTDYSAEMEVDEAPRHIQTSSDQHEDAARDPSTLQEQSSSILMNVDHTSARMQHETGIVKLILVRDSTQPEFMYTPHTLCRLFVHLYPFGRGDFHGMK